MSTYDAINAAYGAGGATDLALQYRKKAREDQYKQDVGTFTKVRLDEANQAAAAAAAEQDAAVQEQVQKRINDETSAADSIKRKVSDANEVRKQQVMNAFLESWGDTPENRIKAQKLIDDGSKIVAGDNASVISFVNSNLNNKHKNRNEQAKILRDYALSAPLAAGFTESRTGSTGAMDSKTLAEAYKKEILDQRPDYQNAGDLAYLKKLHESEGDRSAIESLLPRGTDAIDVAQTAAQKRVEDQRKLEAGSLTNWQRMIATSTDKSKSYDWNADILSRKQKFQERMKGLDRANARTIQGMKGSQQQQLEQFKRAAMANENAKQRAELAALNAIMNIPAYRKQYEDLSQNDPAGAERMLQVITMSNPALIAQGYRGKITEKTTQTSGGIDLPVVGNVGGSTSTTYAPSVASTADIDKAIGLFNTYKRDGKKPKKHITPASETPEQRIARLRKLRPQ